MATVKRNTIKTVVVTGVDLGPAEPHQFVPTCIVKRKKDGLQMTINRSDYGVKFSHRDFEMLEDPDSEDALAAKVAFAEEEKVPEAAVNSSYTEDELKELGTKELKTLPEFARIDDVARAKIKTKGDLVKAILVARK